MKPRVRIDFRGARGRFIGTVILERRDYLLYLCEARRQKRPVTDVIRDGVERYLGRRPA